MHPFQNVKFVQITPPAAIVDNASFTTNVIDTKGFDDLVIVVQLGALDIALTAFKLQEADVASDATTLTSGADVTGAIFGTSTNTAGSASTLPAATADNNVYAFHVNLRGRKRYVKLVATGGDGTSGTYLSALGILSRGSQVPYTVAARGTAQEFIVN